MAPGIRILVSYRTREQRRHLGLDEDGPVRQWIGLADIEKFDSYYPEKAVRVFPDDGEEERGFIPIASEDILGGHDFVPGYEFLYLPYSDGHDVFQWNAFPAERLERWGTAKETKEDEGVRIPEVRIILRWETDHPTRRRIFIDVPLWRTTNMMEKIRECVSDAWPDS